MTFWSLASYSDSQPIRLSTNFMNLIPSLTFTESEWFLWSICNGCGMPAGNTYPSHTWFRPSFWDLLMLQLLRPNFPNLPCLYSTFHFEYSSVLSRVCLTTKNTNSVLAWKLFNCFYKITFMLFFMFICTQVTR